MKTKGTSRNRVIQQDITATFQKLEERNAKLKATRDLQKKQEMVDRLEAGKQEVRANVHVSADNTSADTESDSDRESVVSPSPTRSQPMKASPEDQDIPHGKYTRFIE
jgi:hypothetical protein